MILDLLSLKSIGVGRNWFLCFFGLFDKDWVSVNTIHAEKARFRGLYHHLLLDECRSHGVQQSVLDLPSRLIDNLVGKLLTDH